MKPAIQTVNPPEIWDTRGLYSHVATTQGPTRLIYPSGQVGVDKNGNISRNFEDQVRQALENLSHCLSAVGATPQDILRLTLYIAKYDPENRNRPHRTLLHKFLGEHRPAMTLVPVPSLALPEYLFEIEATAAVRDLSPQLLQSPYVSESGAGRYFDVVVVGAGLSGLQAAYNVQKSGLSCVVLEARDRVGGKTWTRQTSNGKLVDVGAAWINDTNQSKVFELATRLGLEFVVQNIQGDCVFQPKNGLPSRFIFGDIPKLADDGEKEEMLKFREVVEELCHTIDVKNGEGQKYDDITLEDFAKQHGAEESTLATVAVWTGAMLGCQPSELSALYFLDYCKRGGGLMQMRSDAKHGGQYLRITQGTQALSKGIAASLSPGSVLLNNPVVEVSQKENSRVTLETRGGAQYHCRKAIISVPTPLYDSITFSPSLPAWKTQITSATKLGYYAKSIVVFSRAWWCESNFCGMVQSFTGPATVIRDSSDESSGQFSLTCFIVGDLGREWSKLSAHERREKVLEQLSSAFGPVHKNDVYSYIDLVEQEWVKDEWSKGAPCPVTGLGVMSSYGDELSRPFGDVHFVGTEMADVWKGYMDGAIRSGERGSEEVIMALKGEC